MNYIKKHHRILILIAILLLGGLMRSYKFGSFYIFEHDQDLFAWIVKDIAISHHFRLIGQLTSIDGVFIGPLFYYLLTLFFLLFNMNPLGGEVFAVVLGLCTISSLYFVFSRLFNFRVGMIGSLIYAVSLGSALYDLWVVPTLPVILWCTWFLYAIFKLSKGSIKILPLLALLIGLIWEVHIALLPLGVLIIIAILSLNLNKIIRQKKELLVSLGLSIVILLITIAPFLLFEFRHNFQQVNGLVASFSGNRGELKGFSRLEKVFDSSFVLLRGMLTDTYQSIPLYQIVILYFGILVGIIWGIWKKYFSKNEGLLLVVWFAVVLLSQQISKRPISEYYFLSLLVPFLLLISLVLSTFKSIILYFILLLVIGINLFQLYNLPIKSKGYYQKESAVKYIKADALSRNFPCVGINYITELGANVGFRYLFWLNQVALVKPSYTVPVYSLVIPASVSGSEIDEKFGIVGIIRPKGNYSVTKADCQDERNQLLPLLGFSN